MSRRRFHVLVCRGPECGDKRGSRAVFDALKARVSEGLGSDVTLGWQSCFGRCTQGPNVLVRELAPGTQVRRTLAAPSTSRGGATALYNGVSVERVGDIVDGHLQRGRVQRQLIARPVATQSKPVVRESEPSDGES